MLILVCTNKRWQQAQKQGPIVDKSSRQVSIYLHIRETERGRGNETVEILTKSAWLTGSIPICLPLG